MTATSTSITTKRASVLKSCLATFFTIPYGKAVVIYSMATLVALAPVSSGDWSLALKRLLLISASILIYFVITFLFNRPGRLQWLTVAIVAVTTVVAVLGTAQVNTEALRLTGLNYQVYSLLHRFLAFNGLPTVHQNVLGGFLVVFLPLALALALWKGRWWLRIYGLVCALVITGAILTTASRSAQLSLVAILFVFGFLLTAWYPRLRTGVGLILLVTLVTSGIYLGINGLSNIENGLGRVEVWRTTLAMAADYPLTGAGLGQFEKHFAEYATPSLSGTVQPHAHNIYLQSLVEFGLCGFIAILLTLWTTVRLLITYNNLKLVKPSMRPVVAGALAGMVACFTSGLLEYGNWDGKFAPAFWVLPGLLAAAQLKLPPFKLNFSRLLLSRRVDLTRLRLPLILAIVALSVVIVVPLGLLNAATLLRPGPTSQALYVASANLSLWNATPWRNLGKLALDRNDLPAAQLYYRQALQREENDWLSLMGLADLSERQGEHSQAITYWRRASGEPYFLQLANRELARTPRADQAAENYLKLALEINPKFNQATTILVKIYTDTGRKQEALTLLQTVLAQNPDPALYSQAAGLAATPQVRLDFLLKANSLNKNEPNIYWELGEVYQQLNQADTAEKSYKQALELRPTFQRPLRSLAGLYLRQGRNSEAQELVEKFIKNNLFAEKPDREFVLLARAYDKQGNEEAARSNLAKALQYNPDSIDAYLFQGELFKNAGDKERARAAYQKVLQLDPGNGDARQALELLG